MSNHSRALEAIEGALTRLAQTNCNIAYGESGMAIELAYSLDAISTDEHRHFNERRNRMCMRHHEASLAGAA